MITLRAWDQTFSSNATIVNTVPNGGTSAFSTAIDTASVTVIEANSAPVGVADSATTTEDTAVAINVIGNDTDVDGDSLSVAGRLDHGPHPRHAVLVTSGANAGKILYTPAPDYHGPDKLQLPGDRRHTRLGAHSGVDLGHAGERSRRRRSPTARPPPRTPRSTPTWLPTTPTSTALNGDLEVVPGSLSATNGTAVLLADGRTIRFTPGLNLNDDNVDSDGFTVSYQVSDGSLTSASATLTISVTPVNDAPAAIADSATTAEDTAVDTDVVANDTDVDTLNGDLEVVPGSLSATNGTAVLLADSGRPLRRASTATTTDSDGDGFTVSYQVSDGSLTSASATLTISVTPVNDAPAAIADSATTAEDTAVDTDVVANDTDVDTLNVRPRSRRPARSARPTARRSCWPTAGRSLHAGPQPQRRQRRQRRLHRQLPGQ